MSTSAVKNGRPGRDTHGEGPQAPAANEPTANGRDRAGRFQKGHAGGPGNPFARQVAALRSALIEAVTPDDIRAIALELLDQAKIGNLAAIKLLFSYVLGKPTVAPNPDALELDEWQLRQQAPTAAEVQDAVIERRPTGLVNALARGMAVVHQHEALDLLRPETPGPVARPAGRSKVPGEAGALAGLLQAVVGQLRHETSQTPVNNREFGSVNDEMVSRLRLVEALFRPSAEPSGRPAPPGGPSAEQPGIMPGAGGRRDEPGCPSINGEFHRTGPAGPAG